MKRFFAIIFCSSLLFFADGTNAEAQTRGIGVTPARIDLQEVSSWPSHTLLLVTNLSETSERFEVFLSKNAQDAVSVRPSRFILEGGKTARILVTFERQKKETSGLIRIGASRTSVDGFETGTGVEVPFHISLAPQIAEKFEGEREKDPFVFVAQLNKTASLGYLDERVWGGVVILMSIIFLLFLSGYLVKRCIL